MQNARSGARAQHRQSKDGNLLSPGEERGQLLKRYVRAAAALNGIYDDVALGLAAGVERNTVSAWWNRGARMSTATIRELAKATYLSREELTEFVHYEGPPPSLDAAIAHAVKWGAAAELAATAASGEQEAARRDRSQEPATPGERPVRPKRRPRGTSAGRG